MSNNKQRVFLVARKLGVSAQQVRAMLKECGAPPTFSERAAQSKVGRSYNGVPYVYSTETGRDVPRELADQLVRQLMGRL